MIWSNIVPTATQRHAATSATFYGAVANIREPRPNSLWLQGWDKAMAPTADSGVVRVLDEYIRLQELY